MSLLDKLKTTTKILTVSSLLALSAYAQKALEIPTSNNSWDSTIPIEMNYRSQTGGFASSFFAKKDTTKANAYFSGSYSPQKQTLEIKLLCQDSSSKNKDSTQINRTETRTYVFSDENTTCEVSSWKRLYTKPDGKRTEAELVPPEEADGFMWTLADKVLEKAPGADPSGAFISKYIGGIFKQGVIQNYLDWSKKEEASRLNRAGRQVDSERKYKRQTLAAWRDDSPDTQRLPVYGDIITLSVSSSESPVSIRIYETLEVMKKNIANVAETQGDYQRIFFYTSELKLPIKPKPKQIFDSNQIPSEGFYSLRIKREGKDETTKVVYVDGNHFVNDVNLVKINNPNKEKIQVVKEEDGRLKMTVDSKKFTQIDVSFSTFSYPSSSDIYSIFDKEKKPDEVSKPIETNTDSPPPKRNQWQQDLIDLGRTMRKAGF